MIVQAFLLFLSFLQVALCKQGDMTVNGSVVTTKFISTNRLLTGGIIASDLNTSNSPCTAQNIFSEEIYAEEIELNRIVSTNPDGVLELRGDITIESLKVTNSTEILGNNPMKNTWSLAFHDHFDNKNTAGWNLSVLQVCQKQQSKDKEERNQSSNGQLGKTEQEQDYFLGGHCAGNSDLALSKTFIELPRHKHVKIQARVHFFDKWEGETLFMMIDGTQVWSKTVQTNDNHVNICGGSSPDPHFGVPVEINIPHSESQLHLKFESNLSKSRCIASFAIDDVELFVR